MTIANADILSAKRIPPSIPASTHPLTIKNIYAHPLSS